MKPRDLTGQRFGRLTVLGENPEPYRAPGGAVCRRWDCACDCGKRITVPQYTLSREKNGTLSCGCTPRNRGGWAQNFKVCPVCGKRFAAAPSEKKVTCSPECSRVRYGETHEEFFTEGNRASEKHWLIKSPGNVLYEFENLSRFVRAHPEYFSNPASAAAHLAGKRGRYKDWQVLYSGNDTEWRKRRKRRKNRNGEK